MDDYEKDFKMIEELKSYVDYTDDEVSESCNLMCSLLQYPDYINNGLRLELRRNIQDQLKWFQKHARWVETEETITRTVKELEIDY